MAHPGGGGGLAPMLDEFNIDERPIDITLREEIRPNHPYAPWGPITKFYVAFTIHPVRHSIFRSQRRSEVQALPAVHAGVILAREYEGRGNQCVWSGQIYDALYNVGGIDAGIVKAVSSWIFDAIVNLRTTKEVVGVEVGIRVVSTVVVNANHNAFFR